MEFNSSQPKNYSATCEKKKINEEISVIAEQTRIIEKLKNKPIRKFKQEIVSIETISGEPLTTKMWVAEEPLSEFSRKEKELFECEICQKKFDKKQKMLLHARFHSKENES